MPSTLYFPLLKVNFLVIPGVSSLTSPTSFLLASFLVRLNLMLCCSISQVRDISFRTAHQDVALVYANRQPIKGLSLARARYTQSGSTLVERPMRVAHEVPPILADELIADKIQGRRHVPAPIHVGVKASTIIH